jgi:hypothetical protein
MIGLIKKEGGRHDYSSSHPLTKFLLLFCLLQPAGRASSGTAAKVKCYLILYIRVNLSLYINSLGKKYSHLIGGFDLKLPILMGIFKSKIASV